jgi:hypothetical protein
MATAKKKIKKKSSRRKVTTDEARIISVVTVRISDEEKERIDEIMKNLDVKRYSDIMRMAFQMMKLRHLSS